MSTAMATEGTGRHQLSLTSLTRGFNFLILPTRIKRTTGWEMERGGAQIEDKRQGWSCIRLAVEELSLFRPEEKKMSTLAFLGASNLLLHVLDQIGPTMMVLRQDIQRNIERVEETYMLDPNLSITFSLALLDKLDKNPESSLEQVVEETYNGTLKPWHGWISSAAYKVAIKLVPGREMLIRLLMGQEQDYDDLKQDIKKYASVIQPLLDDTYQLLRTHELDRLKST
ncbi:Glycolipid transfer protein (GLTP) [Musa troglodytarum]|uniref:Glycolipid transfer protein (GLTP) n=1 Tax=Musa troglodytarum TaxID=320322 RepID=A0A9E7HP90_9LILI|nr:Glycolipid transfer protein (GLTP) [Musa troglodytarum]